MKNCRREGYVRELAAYHFETIVSLLLDRCPHERGTPESWTRVRIVGIE